MTICIKLIKHKIMKKKELMLLPVMLLSMANVFAQEVGTLQLKDVNGDGIVDVSDVQLGKELLLLPQTPLMMNGWQKIEEEQIDDNGVKTQKYGKKINDRIGQMLYYEITKDFAPGKGYGHKKTIKKGSFIFGINSLNDYLIRSNGTSHSYGDRGEIFWNYDNDEWEHSITQNPQSGSGGKGCFFQLKRKTQEGYDVVYESLCIENTHTSETKRMWINSGNGYKQVKTEDFAYYYINSRDGKIEMSEKKGFRVSNKVYGENGLFLGQLVEKINLKGNYRKLPVVVNCPSDQEVEFLGTVEENIVNGKIEKEHTLLKFKNGDFYKYRFDAYDTFFEYKIHAFGGILASPADGKSVRFKDSNGEIKLYSSFTVKNSNGDDYIDFDPAHRGYWGNVEQRAKIVSWIFNGELKEMPKLKYGGIIDKNGKFMKVIDGKTEDEIKAEKAAEAEKSGAWIKKNKGKVIGNWKFTSLYNTYEYCDDGGFSMSINIKADGTYLQTVTFAYPILGEGFKYSFNNGGTWKLVPGEDGTVLLELNRKNTNITQITYNGPDYLYKARWNRFTQTDKEIVVVRAIDRHTIGRMVGKGDCIKKLSIEGNTLGGLYVTSQKSYWVKMKKPTTTTNKATTRRKTQVKR